MTGFHTLLANARHAGLVQFVISLRVIGVPRRLRDLEKAPRWLAARWLAFDVLEKTRESWEADDHHASCELGHSVKRG